MKNMKNPFQTLKHHLHELKSLLRLNLDELFGYTCPLCGQTVPFSSTHYAQHRVAGWILICKKCYHNLYGV